MEKKMQKTQQNKCNKLAIVVERRAAPREPR